MLTGSPAANATTGIGALLVAQATYLLLGGQRRRIAERDDDIDLALRQFIEQARQAAQMAFCGQPFELHVAAERISVLGESADEWRPNGLASSLVQRRSATPHGRPGWGLAKQRVAPFERRTAESVRNSRRFSGLNCIGSLCQPRPIQVEYRISANQLGGFGAISDPLSAVAEATRIPASGTK